MVHIWVKSKLSRVNRLYKKEFNMADFTTKKVRNIALFGHGGSGKTSFAEAMLFAAGATDRLGKTADGNTVCDCDPEEIKRKFSINLTLANLVWRDTKINIIDTPGFLDFEGEVRAAIKVCGSAVFVVDAKAGVEVGTEIIWERAASKSKPKAVFINKTDDPDADCEKVIKQLSEMFGRSICPLMIPAKGSQGAAGDLVNILEMKRYSYDKNGNRSEADADPDEYSDYREKFYEAVAAVDDELTMKYLEGEEITKEEAVEALQSGIISGEITPVYCGSAMKLWGVRAFLDGVVDSFPYPDRKKNEKIVKNGEVVDMPIQREGPPSVMVFKTIIDQFGRTSYFKVMSGELDNTMTLRNVNTGASEKFSHIYTVRGRKQTEVSSLACGDIGAIVKLSDTNTNDTLTLLPDDFTFTPIEFPEPLYTMAVIPKTKGEEDKIAQGINRMTDEDKTLRFENNPETKQLLISGLGDMQLDVALSRLKARNGVSVDLAIPKVAYRETIRKKVQAEGKHKKQSGGHGQYGHVKITFSPGEAEGLTFTQSVVGGSVPKGYFPAVEKGLLESMQKGVLAGYPVVNLAADLYDGSYHDVDSNELSFKMAAYLAYKDGLPKAAPVLLEPVGELKVTIPESASGTIMGDLNGKRRASVLGMDQVPGRSGYMTISAEAPKAEMGDYAISLRAMTQGKGTFTYKVTRYEEVPSNIAQKIIAEAKASEQ